MAPKKDKSKFFPEEKSNEHIGCSVLSSLAAQGDQEPLEQYLKMVERWGKLTNNVALLPRILPLKLNKTSLPLYEKINDPDSKDFSEIKDALVKECGSDMKQRLELTLLKQDTAENFASFASRVKAAITKAYPSQSERFRLREAACYFAHGLYDNNIREEITRDLLRDGNFDIDDLEEEANVLLTSRLAVKGKSDSPRSNPLMAMVTNKNNNFVTKKDFDQLVYRLNNMQTSSKSIVCDKCGGLNHIARNCLSRSGNNQRYANDRWRDNRNNGNYRNYQQDNRQDVNRRDDQQQRNNRREYQQQDNRYVLPGPRVNRDRAQSEPRNRNVVDFRQPNHNNNRP